MFPPYLKAASADCRRRRHGVDAQVIRELREENNYLSNEKRELEMQIAHFKALQVKLLQCLSHYLPPQQQAN